MFKFISEAIGGVGKAVGSIIGAIDKIDTTEEEKLTLKNELITIQAQAELELARLGSELAEQRASVIKAEVASDSWLAKSWRPILMLTFGFIVVYAVMAPAFGAPPVDMTGIPVQFWTLLTLGITGYVTGRSIEKVAPTIADAWKRKGTVTDS